ncbi:capsule assembly Wzi family protein [Nibrella viscosa]|uniref:Capsule assembly Wzi family protein n=2 Tax=Nibrella viscosa TaxID=1084524 RepID=A0ABP8KTF9_9BACT
MPTINQARLFGTVLLNLVAYLLVAQPDTTVTVRHNLMHYAEAGGLASGSPQTPFWLRANQYGIVPLSSPAGMVRVGSTGHVTWPAGRLKPSVRYGIEAIGLQTRTAAVIIPEAFVSAGLGKFHLYAGRKREVIGLGDSTLSSGFYSWSQNARPMPKVQFGTNGFVAIPFTRGIVAVNALYAHGWFPGTDSMQQSYLHQKTLYGRIGKPGWRVKLYGGLVHNVQWGGYSRFLGKGLSRNGRLPSSLKDYPYVIIAKEPSQLETDNYSRHDRINRFGNHVGSMDIGVEISLPTWTALTYYQHPFDDKSGLALYNLPDGLYGLSLKRRQPAPAAFFSLNHLLVEYLTTLSQSGSTVDIGDSHYEGLDDYFNNFQYLDGWTSGRRALGTPFLTPRREVRQDLQALPGRAWAISNNRVQLLHAGFAGTFRSRAAVEVLVSLSRNYGLFRVPFPAVVGQFSGVARITVPVSWLSGAQLGAAIAVDQGQLLPNNLGGWLSLRKTWSRK